MPKRTFTTGTTRKPDYLRGKLLLAMPNMGDPRFERSVICLCEHSDEGAMGIVVNQLADHIAFPELMEQLRIPAPADCAPVSVYTGGPVEPNRGFVLHSADYLHDTTLIVSELVALSATVDILEALAVGRGPRHSLLALGYAGWGPGQLEAEIQENAWLHTEVDTQLLFGSEAALKWPLAMAKLGIEISMLSTVAGHA